MRNILKIGKLLIITGALSYSAIPLAQAQGVIQGRLTSAQNGSPVSGAQIAVPGTGITDSTDASGNYRLEVPAGSHVIQFRQSGYIDETLVDIVVADGQTNTQNVQLSLAGQIEQLFVIGRAALEGSTASVLSIQREAVMVTEVSGAEEFLRLGDSNAAETLERVTGLTVEDNKFVVIRGQPKRYTSTLFNGSQLPSLDPIQQITPLDLFPSGVLSSIAVQKAYTADRAGSFGSGQVQLSTSGLPTEDFLELKASVGFNESINEDGLEFNTGKDIWGEVDAILKLPQAVVEVQDAGTPIATLPLADRIALGQSFSDELAPGFLGNMGPDAVFSISTGKRFDTDAGGTYGASLNFDYGQKVRVEDEDNLLLRLGTSDDGETIPVIQDDYHTSRTELGTNLGGLLALTAEWDSHRLKSNSFWIRDTSEKVEMDEGLFQPSSNSDWLRRFLLEFEQRELLMQQFTGFHDFNAIQFDWRVLVSNATRELPDRREFAIQNTNVDGSGTFFLQNAAPNLLRGFNSIDEDTFSGGVDMTLPVFDSGNLVTGFKAGFDYDFRDRVSEIRQFGFNTSGNRFRSVEEIFADENIGVDVTFTEFGGVANDYTSEVEILAGYTQLDFDMPERFRIVAGVRLENASFQVETFEAGGAVGAIGVESGFDQQKGLPSLVASWFLTEDSQLRAGLTRSLSYPATVEVSNTIFVDTEASERFQGNPDLEPAVIDSADLRWEWYPSRDEAMTIGAFYKDFTGPIERSFAPVAGGGETITFINADKGDVIGVELNSYFNLGRLIELMEGGPDWLNNMHFGANFAWQDSEVEFTDTTIATNPIRRMTGQPDTLLNLQFGYTGIEHVFRLKFGRVGERLITAGIQDLPDEFLEPRLDLGFKWSWTPTFWPVLEPLTISLEVENLLNDAYERSQGEFITRSYKTGVTGSLSLKWRFDSF